MRKKTQFLLIAVFVAGAMGGFFLQSTFKDILEPKTPLPQNPSPIQQSYLQNPLFTDWTANIEGTILSLNDKNMVIEDKGIEADISLTQETSFQRYVLPQDNNSEAAPEDITAKDLKIGDNVSVFVSFRKGIAETSSVVVFPLSTEPPTTGIKTPNQ
ncbi:MAG: hypothetical protein A3A80_02525 [Candidatus Terrybacteria bacterium RIFCSPLOWO2_01_FULL_44_24]|uniref:DUF5666 domain-containing protein n=1 Tax=Candidatus Terrybacteria bacterium RIFCSPHIGHO2_01_FULL_43_35 TaxID=1802361 RepID=A0A1G2PGK0_9BACT|nr:MAG: hypothetical protein A2828_02320 [Candidatus Terrybacteria bacterium RIFCSPHIGHO2_01_FULL_43_35]OHA50298.1 MAG: hypothetical protein A3B75_00675 [Candidatus Terrybacteria bacterium RIFCSPHIGHO2_02_FULL_43_14]OHA50949.1 MAG: hypothetical protein A3A80_02525 [Candidatus Terrybacteria bacterium RIFCSPLOWO2_01_FULL_44_24]